MKHKVKHIHFVGIAVGMSGIAEVLLNLGYRISGSDVADGVVTQALKRAGAEIFFGHDAHCRWGGCGGDPSAVKADNPEVMAARVAVPVNSRHDVGRVDALQAGDCDCRTHGKTTTTSLVASIFSGCRP